MGNSSQNFNLTTQTKIFGKILTKIFRTSIVTMMRSKASLKFNNLHPESHLKFQNIIRNARLRKNSLEEDFSGDSSDEVSNMLKNKYLSKFREKDDVCVDTRKNGKMLNKKISWSPNLREEIFLDWDPEAELEEDREE